MTRIACSIDTSKENTIAIAFSSLSDKATADEKILVSEIVNKLPKIAQFPKIEKVSSGEENRTKRSSKSNAENEKKAIVHAVHSGGDTDVVVQTKMMGNS